MLKFFILLFFISCAKTPEQTALKFMELRYEDPMKAYEMIEKNDISKNDFMRQHEEMLRVREYELHEIINFKTLSSTTEGNITKVVVETTRPDIKAIFKGFYQEKIAKGWKREEIKTEMLKRLKDKKAPVEKLETTVRVEKKRKGAKVRWP